MRERSDHTLTPLLAAPKPRIDLVIIQEREGQGDGEEIEEVIVS